MKPCVLMCDENRIPEPEVEGSSTRTFDELVCQLPNCHDVNEVMSCVARFVEGEVPGVVNCSLLHLPRSASPVIAAYGAQRQARLKSLISPPPSGSPGRISPPTCSRSKATSGPGHRAAPGAKGGVGTGLDDPNHKGPHLDWTCCCTFNVYRSRGPVVQPPPAWPLTCTAAFYSAVVEQDLMFADNFSTEGPHFQDWTALHLKGAESMLCVPLLACGVPCGVLCLASREKHVFKGRLQQIQLLASALAPYASLLEYTTRTTEMQRLLNEIITPVAAQLAHQKSSQLARLGCSIEEEPSCYTSAEKARRNSGCCISSPNTVSISSPSTQPLAAMLLTDLEPSSAGGGGGGGGGGSPGKAARQRRGDTGTSGPLLATSTSGQAAAVAADGRSWQLLSAAGPGVPAVAATDIGPAITTAAASGAAAGYAMDGFDPNPNALALSGAAEPMDWGSFCFNLISCVIVYVYFSKAAVASESLVAIVLCMGVALFDIVLLLMRWLWVEQYVHYGGVVLSVFHLYRAVVLPVANTFMSYSLLTKLELTPSYGVIALLAGLLIVFVILGIQMRFFLQAPLQMASVLLAASSTSGVCSALLGSRSSLHCLGVISMLQLSLGLLLPSAVIWALEAKTGRAGHTFMPHCVAKRWLLRP